MIDNISLQLDKRQISALLNTRVQEQFVSLAVNPQLQSPFHQCIQLQTVRAWSGGGIKTTWATKQLVQDQYSKITEAMSVL